MQNNPVRKNLIQVVERALNILEVMRDSKVPMRAIDIARKVELSSAAANNIVRTLFIRGYLDQNENGHYILGGQSYLLATVADAWTELRSAAYEPMLALSKKNNSLSFLGVERRGQVVAVNIAESQGPALVAKNQEWLDQTHCTAAGKILLSAMSAGKYSEFKGQYKLHSLTEKTITSWSKLERQIKEASVNGYSICHDESVFGITSIAVPIYDHERKIIAALAEVFSSYYLNDKYRDEAVLRLQNTSREISSCLKQS